MRSRHRRFGFLAVVALLLAAGSAAGQTISIQASKDPAVSQMRVAALGFMEKGQWASAKAGIEQLLTRDPQDGLGLELRRLMTHYDEIEKVRDEQRAAAYRVSTTKVAKLIAQQAWEEALTETTRAADLAPTKADLQKEPWFATLVDKATKLAESNRDKGEWLKATTIYSQMAALYEKEDNQYRRLAKKTARYARLEAIYRDKEETDKQIAGIDEGMMAGALEQIRRFYVREPDYKKMAVGGLECLMAITEVPGLTKALPSLANQEMRDKMRQELTAIRDRANGQEQVGLQELAKTYIEAKKVNLDTVKLPEGLVIREFLDGAIEPLDTFSTMIWPVDKTQFETQINGEFSGVGIQISMEDGQLEVISPLEDTPAYRAGIQAGDVIVGIDGESTQGITLNRAVQRIQGAANTPVVLTIRRASLPQPKDFRLIRETIRILTVKGFARRKVEADKPPAWEYLADRDYRIGYIRITNYMRHTVDELEKAMDEMATQGVRGLIIDLRFNPGGLLTQAVEMSDLFIDKGVIVSTEGRAARRTEERAHAGATNLSLPLIVLVNEYSASAAEIVSGALKDTSRAIIVGDRTYGKGSVQNVIPVGADKPGLTDPSQAPAYLKLTTAYYYLPSGQSIHRHEDSQTWGVEPAVSVKVTRDEVQDILDLRRESDVIHMPGETPGTQPATAPATQPARIRVDPQMDIGLLIMRAELLRRKLEDKQS